MKLLSLPFQLPHSQNVTPPVAPKLGDDNGRLFDAVNKAVDRAGALGTFESLSGPPVENPYDHPHVVLRGERFFRQTAFVIHGEVYLETFSVTRAGERTEWSATHQAPVYGPQAPPCTGRACGLDFFPGA
jgi:hypothetical protein